MRLCVCVCVCVLCVCGADQGCTGGRTHTRLGPCVVRDQDKQELWTVTIVDSNWSPGMLFPSTIGEDGFKLYREYSFILCKMSIQHLLHVYRQLNVV